jgi:hypothetical protein
MLQSNLARRVPVFYKPLPRWSLYFTTHMLRQSLQFAFRLLTMSQYSEY